LDRRQVLVGLLAAPFAAGAQQTKVWRVGHLHIRSHISDRDHAFVNAMRRLGYVEGKNLAIEYRWTHGSTEPLARMARELVDLKVDAIVTSSVAATASCREVSKTTPIVMAAVADPVANGLVNSLATPGGNITGLSQMVAELTTKRLEILHELAPKAARVGYLTSSSAPAETERRLQSIRAFARPLGIEIVAETPKAAADLPRIVSAFKQQGVQGLMVQANWVAIDNQKELAQIASSARLPTIYETRDHVQAGGLVSYGYNVSEMFGRAAFYLDRIFKGAEPGKLAIEQPTKFELVINMAAAKAIGLTIPKSVLLRADELIDQTR
jgi:putative ABC transport system substrate-binding protein